VRSTWGGSILGRRLIRPIWLAVPVLMICLLALAGNGTVALAAGLRGVVTTEQLYADSPEFRTNAEAYQPDQQSVAKIRAIDRKIKVVLFLGTWCYDSIHNAPKLLKALDQAANPNLSLEIIAVDRNKDDGGGLAEKFGLKRVPTVILLADGKELGRITERPTTTMEGDFATIVGGKKK